MAGAMTLLLLSAPASWGAAPQKAKAVPTAEPFAGVVIAEGLAAPWDMVWGPDNHIWAVSYTHLVGVKDHFGQVGKAPYLMGVFGITAADIAKAARKAIARK